MLNLIFKAVCAVFLVLFFIAIFLALFLPQSNQLTFDKCCGGVPCTDTYYSPIDNLCHFSLCERGLKFDRPINCTYNPIEENSTTITFYDMYYDLDTNKTYIKNSSGGFEEIDIQNKDSKA